MKRYISIFSILFVMVFSSSDAFAKKFGGGKSFGKSYKTAPASKPGQSDTARKQNDPAQAPGKSSMAKGLMAGMLGGLLAGGLLASLFGGGFEGFQIMDFLIIALIAFVLFKIFKAVMASKNRNGASGINQAYAGGAPESGATQKEAFYEKGQETQKTNPFSKAQAPLAGSGFGKSEPLTDEVPMHFPAGFDGVSFIQGALNHYRILQDAWNKNQLEIIQEYVTPELYNDLASERRTLNTEQSTQVLFVDAQIVRADCDENGAQLSLQFMGRYSDDLESEEKEITDIWHLERNIRQVDAPWLIVGIQA